MLMLSKMHALTVGGGGDAPFPVNAVDFDGTNDYLLRGSALTGAVDSATGIFSVWLRFDGGDGSEQGIWRDNESRFTIVRQTTNTLRVQLRNSAGTSSLTFDTVGTLTAGGTWKHILASWNTNFSAGNKVTHLYVSDVSDKTVISDASGTFNVDYTPSTNVAVGATTAGVSKFNGCMAELYVAIGQFLDFSDSANRRKFISAIGKPVDLGADGSLPTGSAPIVYLNNPAASFGTNKGTGGDFTITGSLDTASTSPSD